MFGKNRFPRRENDFYPTPKWAVEKLLEREKFVGTVWEPCCGDGSISKILSKTFNVYSSDIINDKYGDQIDFLNDNTNIGVDNIITNPPFNKASEFIIKSKQVVQNKIAMLLRIAFVEGQSRYELFQDKIFPLKKIIIFSKRIPFTEQKSPNFGVAWYIWDRNYKEECPFIEWIK